MGTLDGKVAIVTGAGRGIGRAIAIEYGIEGAKVVVASRTKSTVDEVAELICSAGGEALGVTCDIGDHDQITSMVEQTVAAYGTVDILVNNAQSFGTRAQPQGVYTFRPLEDIGDEEWDWMFDTGVKATLRAMQAVFPYMKESGGKIINFGSRSAHVNQPLTAPYNANKEAIRTLSKTAAREWGQYAININVINPVLETDASRGHFELDPAARKFLENEIPLKRLGQPREAGRVAVFLAGPDSDYLTGMTFYVEGGFTLA